MNQEPVFSTKCRQRHCLLLHFIEHNLRAGYKRTFHVFAFALRCVIGGTLACQPEATVDQQWCDETRHEGGVQGATTQRNLQIFLTTHALTDMLGSQVTFAIVTKLQAALFDTNILEPTQGRACNSGTSEPLPGLTALMQVAYFLDPASMSLQASASLCTIELVLVLHDNFRHRLLCWCKLWSSTHPKESSKPQQELDTPF